MPHIIEWRKIFQGEISHRASYVLQLKVPYITSRSLLLHDKKHSQRNRNSQEWKNKHFYTQQVHKSQVFTQTVPPPLKIAPRSLRWFMKPECKRPKHKRPKHKRPKHSDQPKDNQPKPNERLHKSSISLAILTLFLFLRYTTMYWKYLYLGTCHLKFCRYSANQNFAKCLFWTLSYVKSQICTQTLAPPCNRVPKIYQKQISQGPAGLIPVKWIRPELTSVRNTWCMELQPPGLNSSAVYILGPLEAVLIGGRASLTCRRKWSSPWENLLTSSYPLPGTTDFLNCHCGQGEKVGNDTEK